MGPLHGRGGTILYGVSEERDDAGKPTGIPKDVKGVEGNADAETLRLDSMARDGIEPRIQGLQWRAIAVGASSFVLACWAPKSMRGPHMVVFDGASKFWARGASGKYQLDVQQLREAFVASEGLRERIRAFLLDRVAMVVADAAPIAVHPGPRIVLHVVPVRAFDEPGEARPDLALAQVLRDGLFQSARRPSRYNFDGVLVWAGKDKAWDYTQVFRTGALEFTMFIGRIVTPEVGQIIPNKTVEQDLANQLSSFLGDLRRWGVGGPLLVSLTCVGVKGWRMGLPNDRALFESGRPIDRDVLQLPNVWIEQIPEPPDFQAAAQALRAPFDTLWQSAALEGSPLLQP